MTSLSAPSRLTQGFFIFLKSTCFRPVLGTGLRGPVCRPSVDHDLFK